MMQVISSTGGGIQEETGGLTGETPPITHIPCESVSACGREGREQSRAGREAKKECTEISPCDFCFFSLFFFYIAARRLQVRSLGLLAKFSKTLSALSFSGFFSSSLDSFFFSPCCVTCGRSSFPRFTQRSLEGSREGTQRGRHLVDLSEGR